MRFFLLFLLFYSTIAAAYAQDSVALKQAKAEQLYPQYMEELERFEHAHGHYIQTPNIRMHYLTWGIPTGTPLVWSHGTYGNAYEMYDFGDELAALGYYVIAVDYYGHGLTPLSPKEVSIYHVADDIKFLLDALHIRKAVIGGFSRGGSISTAFYDAYPSTVLGLMLEDGGSAPWAVNDHKITPDSLARRINASFLTRRPPSSFDDKKALFIRMYTFLGNRPDFRTQVFASYNRLKYVDSAKKWKINPGINDLVCQTNAEQDVMANSRPFNASLFAATTILLYPKVIYRNLAVPMIIYDPVGPGDWFNFEEENRLLQQAHPAYIVHKTFQNGTHAVKDEHHSEFINDMAQFIKKVHQHK